MELNSVAVLEPVLRLGTALLLGSAIGFERQWHQKLLRALRSLLLAGLCSSVRPRETK